MNKNVPTTNRTTNPVTTPRPAWWNDQHTSDWDRVKAALRRDWEQTKADFSIGDAVDLNQNAVDTVKQAVGKAPVPPPPMKTRDDTPSEVADRVEKVVKDRSKAEVKMVEARSDLEVEQMRADAKIAEEQRDAQEKIAKARREADEEYTEKQQKIAELRNKSQEKIAEVRSDASEDISKQAQKLSEARSNWSQAEAAMRYGFGAQRHYADERAWNPQLESRLRGEWMELKNGSSWEEARPYVQQGWEYANRHRTS